jgi:hypothetical protein
MYSALGSWVAVVAIHDAASQDRAEDSANDATNPVASARTSAAPTSAGVRPVAIMPMGAFTTIRNGRRR